MLFKWLNVSSAKRFPYRGDDKATIKAFSVPYAAGQERCFSQASERLELSSALNSGLGLEPRGDYSVDTGIPEGWANLKNLYGNVCSLLIVAEPLRMVGAA